MWEGLDVGVGEGSVVWWFISSGLSTSLPLPGHRHFLVVVFRGHPENSDPQVSMRLQKPAAVWDVKMAALPAVQHCQHSSKEAPGTIRLFLGDT